MIKQLQSKLLTQSLVTQSIMDLLIEKKVFTKEQIMKMKEVISNLGIFYEKYFQVYILR